MLDTKIITLLELEKAGSFTKAAQQLHLTQPAISRHIRLLEEELGIKIFQQGTKKLLLTREGKVLLRYAHRLMAISQKAVQAIEDESRHARHLVIGITQTASENMIPQVIAQYCNENPDTHITLITDTINNLYRYLELFEVDIAVTEGVPSEGSSCQSVLLDTDYLCLIVAPDHRFAGRNSVQLQELKSEKMILRPAGTGTRKLFENGLERHLESIRNFNVIIEIDNLAMIKDLVALGLGVSVVARSASIQDARKGRLAIVPIENVSLIREIRMVYHRDFAHPEILEDLKRIYDSVY
ncbi:MAG: LysR family transcriptional regulator [Oscillospiraceae bacterium]|nr:LysR family transcriptional regulator [Oscillospiraceae bacterium]